MKKYYLLLLTLLLVGCEPDIKVQTTITEQKANLPFEIGFNLSAASQENIGQPQVQLYNKYNLALKIPIESVATPKGKYSYTIDINSLDAGEYRLFITIPYHNKFLSLPVWRNQKTIVRDFIVHDNLPYTCFTFDNKEAGVGGWKTTHVFVANKDKPVSQETCPGLFFVENSWPWPLDKVSPGGSLFVPVSSGCFPKTSSQVINQGRWVFSILSPDLSTLPYWQHIKSVQFRIATKNITINVKPELHVKLANGKSNILMGNNHQVSHDMVTAPWRTIEYPIVMDKNAKVTQFELSISGIPEQTVSNTVNSIFIDGICPIQ